MAEGDTFVNALVGAVVTVVLAGIVPFAPVLGGGVAGYLQGGDRSDGVRVGTVSGVIALVPALLVGGFVLTIFAAVLLGGPGIGAPRALGAVGVVAFLLVALVGVVYFVGFSAAGGWLGNYVRHDTDVDL
ncbi:MAG: DUF5518 domain-containing protein [Haloarculaceae archaeon]